MVSPSNESRTQDAKPAPDRTKGSSRPALSLPARDNVGNTSSPYNLAVKAGIPAIVLIVVVTAVVLLVQLQPRHPEISLTSAVFSSPDANYPSIPPVTSAAVFSPAVTGLSSTIANFQFTFSVHNRNHKFNADFRSIHATVGYCPAEHCNPPVLLAQSSVPSFLLSGGQTTTVDASLAGYVPPEVAAGVARDAGNAGSGVFLVNLSAKLKFRPWLPWSNEVMAVCRHVNMAAGSSPLPDQPVKCDTVS